MGGTKEGAAKAKQTIIAKHGSGYWAVIGKKGADSYNAMPKETRKPRGFAANRDLAREAGARGGTISRRKKPDEQTT